MSAEDGREMLLCLTTTRRRRHIGRARPKQVIVLFMHSEWSFFSLVFTDSSGKRAILVDSGQWAIAAHRAIETAANNYNAVIPYIICHSFGMAQEVYVFLFILIFFF